MGGGRTKDKFRKKYPLFRLLLFLNHEFKLKSNSLYIKNVVSKMDLLGCPRDSDEMAEIAVYCREVIGKLT